MKFYSFLLYFICSLIFGAYGFAAPAPKPVAPVSIEGVYEGTITMTRAAGSKDPLIQLPIVFSLQFTDDDISANPDEPFTIKKRIAGAFLLDDEAGPFPLTLSDFEINRAHFNLQYNKLSSLGSPSTTVSLRFECDRRPDGSCSGTVVSALNSNFATFTMHKSRKNSSVLTAVPKYVGEWKGKVSIIDYVQDPDHPKPPSPLQQMNAINKELGLVQVPQDNDMGFYLSAGDGEDPVNPSKLELDSTPKRLGSAWISNQAYNNFIFSTVVFDYFHRKAAFTYVNPAYPTSSLQSTFNATYDEKGNFTSGTWSTANYGMTGNFSAEKVQ